MIQKGYLVTYSVTMVSNRVAFATKTGKMVFAKYPAMIEVGGSILYVESTGIFIV